MCPNCLPRWCSCCCICCCCERESRVISGSHPVGDNRMKNEYRQRRWLCSNTCNSSSSLPLFLGRNRKKTWLVKSNAMNSLRGHIHSIYTCDCIKKGKNEGAFLKYYNGVHVPVIHTSWGCHWEWSVRATLSKWWACVRIWECSQTDCGFHLVDVLTVRGVLVCRVRCQRCGVFFESRMCFFFFFKCRMGITNLMSRRGGFSRVGRSYARSHPGPGFTLILLSRRKIRSRPAFFLGVTLHIFFPASRLSTH